MRADCKGVIPRPVRCPAKIVALGKSSCEPAPEGPRCAPRSGLRYSLTLHQLSLSTRDRHNVPGSLQGVAILRPIQHQPAPFLEQVAAPVRRFDLVADRMREGHFTDLARVGRALRRPITKCRAKAVHGKILPSHSLEQLKHRHVAKRRVLLSACEQVRARRLRLRYLDRPRRQRNAMLSSGLHSSRRNCPNAFAEIELFWSLYNEKQVLTWTTLDLCGRAGTGSGGERVFTVRVPHSL